MRQSKRVSTMRRTQNLSDTNFQEWLIEMQTSSSVLSLAVRRKFVRQSDKDVLLALTAQKTHASRVSSLGMKEEDAEMYSVQATNSTYSVLMWDHALSAMCGSRRTKDVHRCIAHDAKLASVGHAWALLVLMKTNGCSVKLHFLCVHSFHHRCAVIYRQHWLLSSFALSQWYSSQS